MSDDDEEDEGDLNMLVGLAQEIATVGKPKRPSTNALAMQENFKEKMAKFKERRADRYSGIQMTERHICEMVAFFFSVDIGEFLDGMADSDEHLRVIQSFCMRDGANTMIFNYQDGPPYEVETGRYSAAMPPGTKVKRLHLSEGMVPITQKAMAVYKITNAAIDMRNVTDVVFFVDFDAEYWKGNAVSLCYNMVANYLMPPLALYREWGDLNKSEVGLKQKAEFESKLTNFSNFLNSTREDLEAIVTFTWDKDFLNDMQYDDVRYQHLLNPEKVEFAESIVKAWSQSMERTLVQYHQLRKEDAGAGPLVEVEYWRNQLSRMTSIMEFAKTAACVAYLLFLRDARKKLYKIWNGHYDKIVAARNECQDNVKYLYALESFSEPLYRCDPNEIPHHIPALLYAVRNVFISSRYYNTTPKISTFMVKVSNKLVLVCRSYLNCDGTKTAWDQPKKVVIDKIKSCLDLYLRYYQCYKQTLEDMRRAGEKPFQCSESFIFGKLETFKRRIEGIADVLSTTLKYSILQSSQIEGIDVFAEKFVQFHKKISNKGYDALNHRIPDFDKDYAEFRQNVVDTEWELEEFVGKTLDKMQDVDNVLRILQRFEKMNLPCLRLEERFLEAMLMFQSEMEVLRDRYNEERQSPLLPRLVPPVGGRILWIKYFYKRIELPMKVFVEKKRVMKHRKVQKCIQLYNALCSVFVHFENIYHEAWFTFAGQVRNCLNTPILIKHPVTRRYVVNFDPYIQEIIRESEYMYKHNLPVPDVGQVLFFCRDKILHYNLVCRALVQKNEELRKSIPSLFIPLMRIFLLELENAFRPGFTTLTWTSSNIPTFCEEVQKVIKEVEIFVKTVRDMKEARIDEVLDGIASLDLVYLPIDPLLPSQFVEENVKHRNRMAREIELKSATVERAVADLVHTFLEAMDQPELQEGKYDWLDPELAIKPISSNSRLNAGEDAAFKEVDRTTPLDLGLIHCDCNELFSYFNQKFTDSLVKSAKMSLEYLKQRSTSSLDNTIEKPTMLTYMELHIPKTEILPGMDEIQNQFAFVVNNILETMRYINLWGQKPIKSSVKKKSPPIEDKSATPKVAPKNYYKSIAENKDVLRVFTSLHGAMHMVKPDILKLLQEHLRFAPLWADDREQQIDAFLDTNPLLVEVAEKIAVFDEKTKEIHDLPDSFNIGPIQVGMEHFKVALTVESVAWKHITGKSLALRNNKKLNMMVDYIKSKEKILARQIKDLDDCRLAMNCLEDIRGCFIEMDMDLMLMEEAYAIFAKYHIDVAKEDIEKVESLRFNFYNMISHSKSVQETICNIQGPLLDELKRGVATFSSELEAFDADFDANGPMVPGLAAKEASDRVLIFQDRFDDLWKRFEMYSSGERLFGLEVHDYPILHNKKKDFNLLSKLYGLYLYVNNTIDGYFDTLWSEVDVEEISNELADLQNKCRKLPKGMKDWPAYLDLKKKVDDFSETCPLLQLMSSKAMKDRHWKRISNVTQYAFEIESPTFTLKNVADAPLLENKEDVEDICKSAAIETDIEVKLKQVIADWSIVDLTFANFKGKGELLLKVGDMGDIIMMLEDSLMIMNSLLSNRYNAPFKKDIQLWVNKLVSTSEILEKWIMVQNLWIYLEAVFVGGDIAKQLPAEAKRFQNIDKTWVKLMARAHEICNAVECCTADETMGQLLPFLLEQLETCQKSLTGYLEKKRLIFPRFFFISDPVLLEILGQSSDPNSIQPHLPSLFDAVYKVEFDERNPDTIIRMESDNGESIKLDKPVKCQGGVEIWIDILLNVHRDTVKSMLAVHCQSFKDPLYDFATGFQAFPGQAGLVGVQVLWTNESEIALKRCRIDRFIMKLTNDRFLTLLNDFIDLTSKDLTKMMRTHFETMVTIHVHQRDIFDDLCRLKIKTPGDFEWQKQTRLYYYEDSDDIEIKITDAIFLYQNEYLGITERLVITPLTDRCYITLAQAIWINMGGAPAGPAGTGKTETTKDMGRALGKYVVVFNCSDQMDFRGLGRIFKGLAQSGTWGCFDEFNRIDLPVLSVAAQQIYIVLQARKERKAVFVFMDGDNVTMNIEFGIFLTMNPGYAGRQELPENLKIMFRNVAMMVPDRQIIIRVKLASCGFKDNVILARKFFTLYALCEEQLSKQVHYDFGLRNILSVLRTLGASKRTHPTDTEDTTVMRVLRDMNLSKLIDEDEPLFLSLIEDMFPGIKLSVHSWKDLQRGISNQSAEMGLLNHPNWNLKIVQLYETHLVRHGLMMLGPTGAGKTTCIHCLLRTMTECGKPHREMRMNPKAITAPQMFGRLDVSTNDWTDGIFSTLWRRTLKVKKTDYVWLVLDGPVDAVWIENLNSVLDDNKTLTLANGDRIVMAANSKLVFEPDNVDNASPATVSRMGMVFMSSSVLPWSPILEAWLKTRSNQQADCLRNVFGKIYTDVQNFVLARLKPKMFLREAIYIRQCYDVLEGTLDVGEEQKNWTDKQMERLFLFSVMWSLGALLELEDRAKLEEFVLSHRSRMDWPKVKENETIFEYLVNPENGKWQHWLERVEEFYYPPDSVLEFTSILVPNVDNVRTAYLIENTAKQNKSVLLIGEPGTAKTVMIKGYTLAFDPEYQLSKSFSFSSATTPNMVQRTVESYVDKRVGTTYGPPAGKKLYIFIDDINMPVINDWGDQITNEIVRQIMEQGGFYSLDKPGDFSYIVDVNFLAAMIHPGGGRNDIPHRLKRQFCTFNCTLPSIPSMDLIFSAIAHGYFCVERFNATVVEFIPKLISLTRIIWQQTKAKMLPTPANFHYVFNLRDLSKIWQGILNVQRLECQSKSSCLKLWRHECTRVLADRFTLASDKVWFVENMRKTCEAELGDDFEHYTLEETFWVDFLREVPDATGDEPDDFVFEAPKIYEEVPGFEYVKNKLFVFMEQYNDFIKGTSLDMVFFRDAMVNLMIISRIIRTPRGNALLVGVGGSGKQSLTRLASFIANYSFFQIQLTRSYNMGNLMDDMKTLYRVAGQEGKGISFIFTDNEIKDENFLESINNILSSGEIANLFPKDEMDEILNELIVPMKKQFPRRPPTIDNLYDYFISRSRSNLHVALCFSPVGEKFRSRAMKFPCLTSGCTINWFQKWPIDALVEVSYHFLQKYPIVCIPQVKQDLIEIMGEIQDDVSEKCSLYYEKFRRRAYVTPKTFIAFLDAYKVLYKVKLEEIKEAAYKMRTGLEKLLEAQVSVDELRNELVIKEVAVNAAKEEAEIVLAEVLVASEAAVIVSEEAREKKEKAEAIVALISVDEAIANEKLAVALPTLEAANAALQTIKAADIATVRKLGKPPFLITVIMDVVLIYFRKHMEPVKADPDKGFLVTSWNESLKVLADSRFLYMLQHYHEMDLLNAEMIDLVVPYFNFHLYTFEAAKTACGNVAGLISWTKAMSAFYDVNREVVPLKANLAVQRNRLMKAEAEKDAAIKKQQEVEAEVAKCQEMYDGAMSRKQEVTDDANRLKSKMDAATALINGLAGERVRWTEQLETFKAETGRLVGDVLLLVGFLGYTGPFNQEFRTLYQATWLDMMSRRKIPVTAALNIIDSLTDIATIGEWNLQGLPSDELSIQNGIIVTSGFRYPLLIDPQSQGKTWIKNKEAESNLVVTTLNNKYFRNHVEDAVALGYPIMIEDVMEELDPMLDNVLEKNYIKSGKSLKVKVGDKELDVVPEFRMYITTKLSNPSYTPEIFARTSIIDFAVTMQGLEDQLLGRVILTEKRELETERTNLIKDVTANRRKMKELEENLLFKLTTTQGSLLDDESVITVLNITKTTATEVKDKINVARETEIKINAAREEFRPVATRGSVLYFLVVSMAQVNQMYQTSLTQFLERFDISMIRSDKSPLTAKRINNINDYLTLEIFKYKSRGLYERHKDMFVLMMCLRIDLDREYITHQEFLNFIKGGAALDLNACPPKPAKWITDLTWLNVCELSKLRQFFGIVQQVTTSDKIWKAWFDKNAPEESTFPFNYGSLDVFRRLLLIRAWCPDRTITQSRRYIANSLGQKFAEPVILNFETMFYESRPLTPMVCFLSIGSDPTPYIESLAKKLEVKVKSISMGQGQEVHARKLMTQALTEGFWALLQNCHLSLDYMTEVMIQFMELEKSGISHPDFRFWITTEEHDQFPISLLQICIKFTNEAPSGIRAGLLRTYTSMSQDMLDYSDSWMYIPLIYAISFMHTVVQERRKFGPLGWNIPYEYNSADWLASCCFVQNHLDDIDPKKGISWVTLRYMLGEVHYGGRVTDDFDKILLNTFTRVWFNDSVFSDEFEFYKGYKVITFKQVTEYLAFFETMSPTDPPQVYGLHSNADITYQTNMISNMLGQMLSIQPKESGGGGGDSRETVVKRMAADMLSKIPSNYDPFEVNERLKAMNNLNPLVIFLKQEIDRMQKVISIARTTLRELILAIEGTIIMSENLRDALDNIYDARVPASWLKASWAAATLGFWFTEFLERDTQFRTWCFEGRPLTFWMAGFFNPQGFLTAMRQEVARAHKGWALDQVSLFNTVTKCYKEEIFAAPVEGVFVYGLFLDGCGWDKRNARLAESINKVLYTLIPVIHVYANYMTTPKLATLYVCPVYKKARRTGLNYITALFLPTHRPPEHWTLRGAALLCDTQ